MKISPIIAVIALLVFGASHFLPAYHDYTGFRCEEMCWGLLCKEPIKSPYYSAFALTNLAFVVLAALSFTRAGGGVFNRILATLMLVHVLSWFAMNAYSFASSSQREWGIQIGYYLWALAYGLLLWACFEKKKVPNQTPEPTAPSGRGSA